jgi:CO dehydrogenase maturation factor
VALHSAGLARDLDIPGVHLVVNRCRTREDSDKVTGYLGDHPFTTITHLPFDEAVMATEPDVTPLMEMNTPYVQEVRKLAAMIA